MTDASHAAVMGLSNATGAVPLYRHLDFAHSPAPQSSTGPPHFWEPIAFMAQDLADRSASG